MYNEIDTLHTCIVKLKVTRASFPFMKSLIPSPVIFWKRYKFPERKRENYIWPSVRLFAQYSNTTCWTRALNSPCMFARAVKTRDHKLTDLSNRILLSLCWRLETQNQGWFLWGYKGNFCSSPHFLAYRWLPPHSDGILSLSMSLSKFPLRRPPFISY